MSLTVALIQYDVIYGDPAANFKKVSSLINKAAEEQQPDVIVLPEMWNTGYDLSRLDDIGDKNGTETKRFISELAKKHQINIIAGSIGKTTDNGNTNTMMAFNREGHELMEYSKVHLFRLMEEEKYLVPGNNHGHFQLEGIDCAGFICYDIRFPEWMRLHTSQGAKVLFVPAEWPKPRVEHWRTLLISRAIENQCYVIGCNRSGSDPKNEFGGHSIIIDPWGNVAAEADTEEHILAGTIEPQKVAEIRQQIPVFEDRRPHLYSKFS